MASNHVDRVAKARAAHAVETTVKLSIDAAIAETQLRERFWKEAEPKYKRLRKLSGDVIKLEQVEERRRQALAKARRAECMICSRKAELEHEASRRKLAEANLEMRILRDEIGQNRTSAVAAFAQIKNKQSALAKTRESILITGIVPAGCGFQQADPVALPDRLRTPQLPQSLAIQDGTDNKSD
jgi:hypothetical protein